MQAEQDRRSPQLASALNHAPLKHNAHFQPLTHRDPECQFPYVYTSPAKSTLLRRSDMVYVLATQDDLPS